MEAVSLRQIATHNKSLHLSVAIEFLPGAEHEDGISEALFPSGARPGTPLDALGAAFGVDGGPLSGGDDPVRPCGLVIRFVSFHCCTVMVAPAIGRSAMSSVFAGVAESVASTDISSTR